MMRHIESGKLQPKEPALPAGGRYILHHDKQWMPLQARRYRVHILHSLKPSVQLYARMGMMNLSAGKNPKENSMRLPLLIVMAVMIVAAVFGYTRSIRNHLKEQAHYAVQQSVAEITNEIEASVGFAKSSIRLTSQSATQSMTSDVIEDVNAILDPLLDSTPFNFIEYILADGWNTMNDGGIPFDASDREYY